MLSHPVPNVGFRVFVNVAPGFKGGGGDGQWSTSV